MMRAMSAVLARFLLAVADVLEGALWLYMWVVIVAVVISWVSPSPHNPIVQILGRATQPAFSWVRRTVPGMMRLAFSTGLDLSPMVVLAVIYILRQTVPFAIRQLAAASVG